MTEREKRTRTGIIAGAFGIFTNIAAFVIKLLVGMVSGSVSIVADAVNSLTDAGSSVLTMVGFRLSAKPADHDHPYGHARYEQLTALFISVIMLAVGLVFAKSSVEKIVRPAEITVNALTYSALFAAIGLKLIQTAVYYSLSKKIGSDALKASGQDSRNDVLMTSAVLLSVAVMDLFSVNIDGWAGLVVSLFIIFSAASSLRSAISPMLGAAPPDSLVNDLLKIVYSRPEIHGHHDLVIHNYGTGANFATLHAEIDPDCDLVAIHEVIDGIEHQVQRELGVVLTIHLDPTERSVKDEKEES